MDTHLKFLPGQQREFLLQVAQKSGLSLNELAKLSGTVPRNYRDWLREKINISLKATEIFCGRFEIDLPESKEALVARWKEARLRASKVGGFAHFQKYGSPGTPEGRSKGGRRALAVMRRKGIIPLAKEFMTPRFYTEQLAEMVGILLGDGSLTQSQTTITLNGEADKDYVPFVKGLGEELFAAEPKFYPRNDSKAVTLCYHGVRLVEYLLKVGLVMGNKVQYQVDVPQWIKEDRQFAIACLRGLMDTDGGVFLHRYKVNGKQYVYKKICFSNRSLPLLYFVADTLTSLGLSPKVVDKVVNKKLWLYNKDEVERYLALVGTHNPRLLKYQNG